MDKKLITEQIAIELVNMLHETDMSESDRKDVYNQIMEYKTTQMKLKSTVSSVEQKEIDATQFYLYFNRWDEEVALSSNTNLIFTNSNFKSIIAMGERAVPFIKDVIEDEPDTIVYALPFIFKDVKLKKEGLMTLDVLCNLWLDELKKKGY